MDNTNNPNPLQPGSITPPTGGLNSTPNITPDPLNQPSINTPSTPSWQNTPMTPDPSTPTPAPVWPSTNEAAIPSSIPSVSTPIQSAPDTSFMNPTPAQTIAQPQPVVDQSFSQTMAPTDPLAALNQTSQTSTIPTLTTTASDTSTLSNPGDLSALDNPMGSPIQPPAIDTPVPSQDSTSTPPWASNTVNNPIPPLSIDQTPVQTPPPATPVEQAPTDLSHLISNPVSPTNETLVVSNVNANPEVPTVPSESHKPIPKWLVGVGIGLLLIVVAASAYFILGIGQPAKTTSIPATQAPAIAQVKPTAPVSTPAVQPQQQSGATESASFGQLQGSTPVSGTQPQATSAAELLKQRQQQGR